MDFTDDYIKIRREVSVYGEQASLSVKIRRLIEEKGGILKESHVASEYTEREESMITYSTYEIANEGTVLDRDYRIIITPKLSAIQKLKTEMLGHSPDKISDAIKLDIFLLGFNPQSSVYQELKRSLEEIANNVSTAQSWID